MVVPVTTVDRDADRMLTRVDRLGDAGLEPFLGAGATAPEVAPDASAVAFLREVDGQKQLHSIEAAGGEARVLTDLPHGVLAMRWLPDASGLIAVAPLARSAPTLEGTRALMKDEAARQHGARTTEARLYRYWDRWLTDERAHHLFRVDRTGATRHLTFPLDAWLGLGPMVDLRSQLAIAPAGDLVVFSAASIPHGGEGEPALPRYALWALDPRREEPAIRALTPANPAADTGPVFVDQRTVVFGARSEPRDYASPPVLTRLDVESGVQTSISSDWDLAPASWTFHEGALWVVAEERARMRLFTVDPETGERRARTELAGSWGDPVFRDGGALALHQSIDHPARLTRVADGAILADPNADSLAGLTLGAVTEHTFAGARGDDVQLFVVDPPDAPAGPLPLVHMIHGGPHGTFGDVFHFRWNAHAFAAGDYRVALVNFHGSTSFGHESTRSIHGAWGEMPAEDILRATDWLVERGLADPERMAITGGSYGGYLAAWIPTLTSRFRCAIAHAAVTDLGAMLASDWTLGLDLSLGAPPTEDAARVARWSPSAHWRTHETPTLVIHGERDYRVPLSQGLGLYGALRAKGVPARLVVYPEENHWILRPANAAHWYGEVHDWLARHLR